MKKELDKIRKFKYEISFDKELIEKWLLANQSNKTFSLA